MNNNPAPSTQESLISVSGTPPPAAASYKPSLKETLEIASKTLIGLAGLCYVLGLLVVILHLRKYGLNSLSLSQLHYVTAGVWVMLPALVGVLYCIFVKVFYDNAVQQSRERLLKAQQAKDSPPSIEPKDETLKDIHGNSAAKGDPPVRNLWKLVQTVVRNPKVRAIVGAILIPALSFSAAVGTISEKFGIQLSLKSLLFIPAFGTIAFGSASLFVFALLTARIKPGNENFMPTLMFGGMGAFLFILYVSFFAVYTYEEIPWSTGGGRPSQVEFVFADDEKTFLESAGIKVGSVPNRSESLKLLLVTETEYVIITADGKAISVPASSVKSVIYAK